MIKSNLYQIFSLVYLQISNIIIEVKNQTSGFFSFSFFLFSISSNFCPRLAQTREVCHRQDPTLHELIFLLHFIDFVVVFVPTSIFFFSYLVSLNTQYFYTAKCRNSRSFQSLLGERRRNITSDDTTEVMLLVVLVPGQDSSTESCQQAKMP